MKKISSFAKLEAELLQRDYEIEGLEDAINKYIGEYSKRQQAGDKYFDRFKWITSGGTKTICRLEVRHIQIYNPNIDNETLFIIDRKKPLTNFN